MDSFNYDTNATVEFIIEKIIAERKKQGLSHEKLAEKAGLHRSTVSLLESRKTSITLKNVLRILTALNMKLSDILLEFETKL